MHTCAQHCRGFGVRRCDVNALCASPRSRVVVASASDDLSSVRCVRLRVVASASRDYAAGLGRGEGSHGEFDGELGTRARRARSHHLPEDTVWGAPKGAPTSSEPCLGSVNISYQSRIINPAGLLAAGGGCAGKAQRACLVSSIACCAAAARVRLHWLGSQLFFVVRIVVCSELFDSSGSCVRLKDGSAKPSPRNDVAVDVEPHVVDVAAHRVV